MICEYCKKEFSGHKRRFCCKRCRMLAYNRKEYKGRKKHKIVCQYCGKSIMAGKVTQKYCSRKCTTDATIIWKVCVLCGKMFRPKRNCKGLYCSRKCQGVDRTIKNKQTAISKETRALSRIATYNKQRICVYCGGGFCINPHAQLSQLPTVCSPECNRARMLDKYKGEYRDEHLRKMRDGYKWITPHRQTCIRCGSVEVGRKRAIKHCTQCAAILHKDRKAVQRHKRRARIRGVKSERVRPLEIFKRDMWLCGICGGKIDKTLKYPHLMSVSLDHIKALANGGTHTKDNVQAAHFLCNSRKSDMDERYKRDA